MSMDRLLSLDTGQFKEFVFSQVSSLQTALLLEHEREVSSLKAENQLLRERLSRWEDGNARASSSEHDGTRPFVRATQDKPFCLEIDAPRMEESAGAEQAQVKYVTPNVRPEPDAKVKAKPSDERKLKPPSPKAATSVKLKPNPKPTLRRKPTVETQLEEQAAMPFLKRMVLSKTFECSSGLIILANTLMMALQLQYSGIDIGFAIEARNYDKSAASTWPHAEEIFYWVDVGFTVLFCIELMLRFGALRLMSFRCGWMWFDSMVIGVSAIDTFGSGSLPFNPGMLRILRLVRLVRLFKLLKVIQAFDSLFLLLKAIVASMHAALWSLVVLFAIQLVAGLFLSQLLQNYFVDEGATKEDRRIVFNYFGTFSGTMLTMFQITMSNWVLPCRALVENVNECFMLFFIIYRCFFCFAVLKVIAAVFITETNRVLQHDDELTLMKLHREQIMFDRKVKRVTNTFEEESFGWNELESLAYDREVGTHLKTLGFKPQDLEKLFWLIDEGSGRVSVDEFLDKVKTLKGEAKSIDLQTVLKIAHKIDREVTQVFGNQGFLDVNEDEEEIEDLCCEAHRSRQPVSQR